MNDASDADLLEQFVRDHSEVAFTALVERHIGLVHSVALRHTATPQHAQDITQVVFIILARKAAALSHKTILSGWLYHTARLVAANDQRAEIRRIRREQEAFMQSTLHESVPDPLWQELSPLLDDAMSRLRASDRDALVLRYFQNKSLAEVGAVMGLAERTAQKRILRAIEKLRKIFAKHGATSTTDQIVETVSASSVLAVSPTLAKAVAATAFAKGATASASILTLTKGVLKIMAWTKAKTAVVAGTAALLAIGTTTVTIITIQWMAHLREGYAIYSHVEKTAQGYDYVWTVHNQDQIWGLDQFAVEVPINTHVLTNSVPPPFDNSDTNAYWTIQETRQAQIDDHDGQVWLPAAKPGKKWILWWGQQSPSVYPSNSIVTFSLTTDAATKPGKVANYAVTYTPQNDPHYYHSFRSKVTGPAN